MVEVTVPLLIIIYLRCDDYDADQYVRMVEVTVPLLIIIYLRCDDYDADQYEFFF